MGARSAERSIQLKAEGLFLSCDTTKGCSDQNYAASALLKFGCASDEKVITWPCMPSGLWTKRKRLHGYGKYSEKQESVTTDYLSGQPDGREVQFKEMRFLAKQIARIVPLQTMFGICHGSRSGREQAYLSS